MNIYEELLTEEEKSTDELNIGIMHLKLTSQKAEESYSVFSLFRNNQYAADGKCFADTAWTVLPEIVSVNLNNVEEAFAQDLILDKSNKWEKSQMRSKPHVSRKLQKKKEY